MDDKNPSADEPVIYRSEKIISDGTRYTVTFTDRRFILAENGTGAIREDLSYTTIVQAISGFNTLREPVIALSLSVPDAGNRELELIFFHQSAGLNIQDRDKCLVILRTKGVPVDGSAPRAHPSPSQVSRDRSDIGERTRPAVPEWNIFGTTRNVRPEPVDTAPPRSPLFIIVTALLVVGLCIGGVVIAGHILGSRMEAGTDGVTGVQNPAPLNPVPTVTLVTDTGALPGPSPTASGSVIPVNGVWVRISYPGNFTGSVGADGWMTPVNSSGIQWYQLPVHDTAIEGTITKTDGSGSSLTVGVYNGGTLVSESTTSKPRGSIDLDLPIGPSIDNSPVVPPTTAVVAPPPTPDASLVQHAIPPSGVWVRVAYPGNFTGTVTANGLARDVNSSGDQFFRFPMIGGTIDAFLSKGDGSVGNMVVQVYRDGTLVTYDNTSAPLGTVEIHTTV